jgi:hypothetical protein
MFVTPPQHTIWRQEGTFDFARHYTESYRRSRRYTVARIELARFNMRVAYNLPLRVAFMTAYRIDYSAPQHVRDAVASLGRTEDARFSPNNQRLALAEFLNNRITVFDVSIADFEITLTGATQISSPHLKNPHGIDFINEEKFVVVNRDGQACIFELPIGSTGKCELIPLFVSSPDKISTPGSVAVIRDEEGVHEALIINTYAHAITKHFLNFDGRNLTKNGNGAVLLKRWLNIPDGICVSKDMQWIAVSNHNVHTVLIYNNKPTLNEASSPDGILLRGNYPHGLRFTSDGRFMLVANAGSPYVNIYEKGDSDWRGVRNPILAFKVLDDEDFWRGRTNRQEGGAKGIDLDNAMKILVATSVNQPLAFFNWRAILASGFSEGTKRRKKTSRSSRARVNSLFPRDWRYNQKVLAVKRELYRGRITAAIIDLLRWALIRARTISKWELAVHRYIPRP